MKISKNFVIAFLVCFLAVIVGNVAALSLGFYADWMLYLLVVFLVTFGFLFFRKKLNSNDKKKQDKYLKIIKLFFTIIPLLIIGYIFYANFIASHQFNYFYDIGSQQDSIKPYLTPLNRVSNISNESNVTYRNLTSNLVYFDVAIPRGSDKILIQTKLKYNDNSSILLGAKNKEEWSYSSQAIYNPLLENLNLSGEITRLNKNMPQITSINDIPAGSVVATDQDISLVANKQDYPLKNLTLTYSLRDSHTFYIYLKDSLNLYVEKIDINWYNGSDELQVNLYDLRGNLLGNATLQDDGVTNASKLSKAATNGTLILETLPTGVNKLNFKGTADTIITKININTNKIVANKLFSADSSNYINSEDKLVKFYTESDKNSTISFQTNHQPYLQNININNHVLELNNRTQVFRVNLTKGEYLITSPKSNVIITSANYLTFSKDNYFEPFEYKIVSIPTKKEDLQNIDYLIASYSVAKKQDDWIIVGAEFDMKDLYIKNGKLNLMFTAPSLAQNQEGVILSQIPVDYINITVYKNGIFTKN